VPCHHTYAHHLKLKASSTTRSISRASTNAYTFKVIAVVFCEPFRTDQSTYLARLAVNDTTTPDNTTVLHKSIKSRPSPRPCCATPPSLAVVDEVDANRFALEPLQPASSPKMMLPRGRTIPHAAISASGDLDLGFPPELPELGDKIDCNKKLLDDASMEGLTLRVPPSTDLRI
jgi:hypothetical protein